MPQYLITTPEQVHFRYQVAGLVSRAMAWVLDQLLLMVVRVAAFFLLAWFGLYGIALLLVLYLLLGFGYYVVCELYMAGQSPGKKVFHLRVIADNGGRLTFAHVMIRNLIRPLDTLPFAMLLGGTVAWLDGYQRRLGDLAAGTLVVRDARQIVPQALRAQHGRDNSYQSDPAVRGRILARITREQRDLIFDLMHRRDQLEPEVREDLFAQTAAHLRTACQLPADHDHLTDEQAVLNVALVLEAGQSGSSHARR